MLFTDTKTVLLRKLFSNNDKSEECFDSKSGLGSNIPPEMGNLKR